MTHFRNLIVWQKSFTLSKRIYQLTERFPSDQRFRLVDQMQRASVSVSSNIAEGSKRQKIDSRSLLDAHTDRLLNWKRR